MSRTATAPNEGSTGASMTPERGDVKLAGPGQRTMVDAFLLTSLAVHRSVNHGAAWTITHRVTGCAIGYLNEEAAAISAAKDIEQQHPDAMAKLDKLAFGQHAPWKRRPPEIKRLVVALEAMGLRSQKGRS